jgi:hypothetical protein
MEVTDKKGNALELKADDAKGTADLAKAKSKVADFEKTFDTSSDCHGTTFASGQVWINNDQVGKIIKGDGYRQVTGDEKAQAGDVLIYLLVMIRGS